MASIFKSFTGEVKKLIDKGSSLVSGQAKAVRSLSIFIITTLLNQLATNNFFKCPAEDKHEWAGWSFIFAPGVILGIILLMSSDRVSQGSILYGKKKDTNAWFYYRTISLSVAYSALAFLSWVVASLLFTEIYACTKLGPVPNTKNQTKIEIYNSKKTVKIAESKVLGLYVLLGALAFEFALYLIHKCCLSDLSEIHNRLKSMDCYDRLEAEGAKAKFELLVEEHGKVNGEREVEKLVSIKLGKSGDSNEPAGEPSSEDNDNENEPKKDVWSRAQIEELRADLIRMYPRLENPLDRCLPYKIVKGKGSQVDNDKKDGASNRRSSKKAMEGKLALLENGEENTL